MSLNKIMRKELPLKHIEEPKKIAKGAESEVFKFKPEKGKKYVYKEVYRVLDRYHRESLEETISDMKGVYDVLKKHYGDNVVTTYFIIGKDKEGGQSIIKIQEEIEGNPMLKLKKNDPRFKKAEEQVHRKISNDIFEVVIKITEDPRFKDYSTEKARRLICDVAAPENIIVDKKGNIKIIDW